MLDQSDEGVTVDGTVAGSPAERAGLERGDRVVRINGRPIEQLAPGELGQAFNQPEAVSLLVRRGGNELKLQVTPERVN